MERKQKEVKSQKSKVKSEEGGMKSSRFRIIGKIKEIPDY